MTKPYNTTDLDPQTAFERHIFHRDQFAHYLRWTHVLKEAKIGDTIVDFGCGSGNLLEVLYRNRFKPSWYVGLDIRESALVRAREKFKACKFPVQFLEVDLVHPTVDLSVLGADRVVSFEVLEHVGKQNAPAFLQHLKSCGSPEATYYLSTPNYDEQVGAAGNHTYDSGDGSGMQPQELAHKELEALLEEAGFQVVKKFGTFASQRDYKATLNEWQRQMYDALAEYYDTNLIANLMAPVVPAEQARNCLWVLKAAG